MMGMGTMHPCKYYAPLKKITDVKMTVDLKIPLNWSTE
jgi:hypothetical protein